MHLLNLSESNNKRDAVKGREGWTCSAGVRGKKTSMYKFVLGKFMCISSFHSHLTLVKYALLSPI